MGSIFFDITIVVAMTTVPFWLSLLCAYSGPKLYKEPSAKSNKHIIQNALSHCCLAGKVNEGQKNKILEVIAWNFLCGGPMDSAYLQHHGFKSNMEFLPATIVIYCFKKDTVHTHTHPKTIYINFISYIFGTNYSNSTTGIAAIQKHAKNRCFF